MSCDSTTVYEPRSQSGPSVALVREAQINAGHSPADAAQLFLNLITIAPAPIAASAFASSPASAQSHILINGG